MALLSVLDASVVFTARKGLFAAARVRALDGVSLHLDKGESLSVVGESGSGKTTLARVVLGLQRPAQGQVAYEGKDIGRASEGQLKEFRRRAQGIFQDPFSSLDPYMTVGQIVEEPLVIHHVGSPAQRVDKVRQALEEVRLTPVSEIAPKFTHQLSGGQRQRVAIARALVLEPELIVADEPVSMVDASSRAEILYLMRELQERHGTAFLYITHDIATAYHFSQRIAVMYLGRIVETGPTRQVIGNPLHPYTQALLQAVPEPDPANRFRRRGMLAGEPPSPANPPAGCRFHPRCPYAFEGCDRDDPHLLEVTQGQEAACRLWKGLTAGARLTERAPGSAGEGDDRKPPS
ncbi:MAG: ABC transporter ATP-binding protein [Chloroflexi bacterium]|nr:ABC transporter ATP-binding protein [Chloroflexota bacterium]